MLRKIVALGAIFFYALTARADEGMWIPSLIGKNYDQMKRMGLKLSKEDIYSINQASLKDAIVQFAGGCTGEIMSPNGLLFTNHHCGYDAIAGLSSVGANYLRDGFWAKNMSEELPAPGVTALFLQRIEDVTDEVHKATAKLKGDKLDKKFDELQKTMEQRYGNGGKMVVQLKEYFAGNQYLVLISKRYTDIRLVGTPPESLGKFGGDTDNWVWPRHTVDFSVFRVYAGKDNEPASYNKDNVPFKAKKYLPVSIKGLKEGDFAMIMGYPGRTNRYEVSQGVDMSLTEYNPSIVRIRGERLAIMKKHMDQDEAVNLKMASNYASTANYWKYFQGQTEQLKRLNVLEQKRQNEKAFSEWAAKNRKGEKDLSSEYDKIYAGYTPIVKSLVYYGEAFRAPGLAKIASTLEPLQKALADKKPADTIKKYVGALTAMRNAVMKNYVPALEEEVLAATAKMYYQDIPASQQPDIYAKVVVPKFGNKDTARMFQEYAHYLVTNTFLLDSNRFNAFVANPTLEAIQNDPMATYAISFVRNYNENFRPKAIAFQEAKSALNKRYIGALMAYNQDKMFYPDANSTMRLTYGQVLGYDPRDGVHYNYYTTHEGVLEKYIPGDDEFDLPLDFVTKLRNKDFGRWADENGDLVACFITNNDITGGNSGSPIINGNGEYVGIAFDGNWEAMSGDISFDQNYKRTISTDVRFMLFVIDKIGNAQNIINELEIRK